MSIHAAAHPATPSAIGRSHPGPLPAAYSWSLALVVLGATT